MRMIAIAALAAGVSTSALAQSLEGYTCCNLHYEADWISDGNWSARPMIPAGARIRVLSYGWWNNRAFVEIDGTPFRLGHDYGRAEEPLDRFVSKWIVPENPRDKIALYPEHVKTAIFDGKVIEGMTREQVIIAVGYPPTHQTRTLDSPLWSHWVNRMSRYEVHWSQEGTVQKIVGRR